MALPLPLCLEVHRVGALPVLIECVQPGLLVLSPDGTIARPKLSSRRPGFGTPTNYRSISAAPQVPRLHIDWARYDHRVPSLVLRTIVDPHSLPSRPSVDGVAAQQNMGTLKLGQVLRWEGFVVMVGEVPWPSAEELAMANAARTSDSALHVYADWLETNGKPQSAEWLRLLVADPNTRQARMADLATRVGFTFRALVGRGPVERCAQRCLQGWEQLQTRPQPWLRTCTRCGENVTWTDESFRLFLGGPMVLDPSAPRGDPEEDFPMHIVG